MPSSLAKIIPADMAALATLATTKLTPATPYQFAPFAGKDQIALPTDITPTPTYSGAGDFLDGSKVTFRVYGYKTIAGKKTYTSYFRRVVFTGTPGTGFFSLTWNWTPPVTLAPEGYIIVIPLRSGPGWIYFWQDIGLVHTFTADGSFSGPAWKNDVTLDADNNGTPTQNLPCGHGAWLKVLNQIWRDFFARMDIFGGSSITFDDTFLVSGPWVVSAGPKCYLYVGGASVLASLKFIYSEADSATGNELAPEADMFAIQIGVVNGANHFDWNANVKVNGRIVIFSPPAGQAPADWALAASHPGITITFDPHYQDGRFVTPAGFLTAFIFDFVDVQYTVGTPVVLTCTPLAGGSVFNPGNPAGGGASVDCTFTGDTVIYTTSDTIAIHLAGKAAKAAALPSTLAPIILTTPAGGTNVQAAHHRAFCHGVYTAHTLPTLGLMTYLDVDLPQYNPLPATSGLPASSRRALHNTALPPLSVVTNKGALWPVFRDTDFVPDAVGGRPIKGSKAWNVLGTKYPAPIQNTDTIHPEGGAGDLHNYSIFVPAGTADVRFYTSDPNLVLYVKADDFPSITDHDASAPGGTWLSLKDSLPGFETDTTWFYSVGNPTDADITSTTTAIPIFDDTPPTGTFFPTRLDDDNESVAQLEGASYHFADPTTAVARPIPPRGYCVFLITVRRQPVANAAGIAVTPSTGTADLAVKIGTMIGFSFDSAGVFEEIQTITVPAGAASVTVPVFLPVIDGVPLVYQCAEVVIVLAPVNFQPMMHSSFSAETTLIGGVAQTVGYYDGPLWYSPLRTLLFFKAGVINHPILLPLAADVYNDLTAALNLM